MKNVQQHYEALSLVNIPLDFFCLKFYDLQYMYIYIMYAVQEQFTQTIQIPRQNKITFVILIKHTTTV